MRPLLVVFAIKAAAIGLAVYIALINWVKCVGALYASMYMCAPVCACGDLDLSSLILCRTHPEICTEFRKSLNSSECQMRIPRNDCFC